MEAVSLINGEIFGKINDVDLMIAKGLAPKVSEQNRERFIMAIEKAIKGTTSLMDMSGYRFLTTTLSNLKKEDKQRIKVIGVEMAKGNGTTKTIPQSVMNEQVVAKAREKGTELGHNGPVLTLGRNNQ